MIQNDLHSTFEKGNRFMCHFKWKQFGSVSSFAQQLEHFFQQIELDMSLWAEVMGSTVAHIAKLEQMVVG